MQAVAVHFLQLKDPTLSLAIVDVIDLVYSGLTASAYYYIKISPSDTGTTYIESRSAPPAVCNCITSPGPCERVCNGDFEDYISGLANADVERACPWERIYTVGGIVGGTPDHWDISGFGSNLDGAIGMVCGQNVPGFIFQEYAQVELEQPIANGELAIVSYYLKRSTSVYTSTSLKYTVDHFAGVLSNGPLVQPAGRAGGSFPPPIGTIEVDYNGTLPANWTQVTEIISNGTGATLDHIGFGVFEDDATLGYIEIDPNGFPMAYTLVDEVSVTRLEECSGDQYCVGESFDIGFTDLPSGLTFQWYHPLGNVISGATSSTYNFISVAFSDAGVYTLKINDGTNTYDVEYELIVVDCCTKVADIEVPLDNNTSSYLINSLNGGNSTVTGQIVRINGQFTVDQDITFSSSDVLMGIDAKIILDPGKTITFLISELKPCDDAMYEGIIADREDESIIFRSSTARGGKTALASYNNAKLTVVGSDFEDNYIGIGVYDFQPTTFPYTPSQITIHGNDFTHSGSNLIAPYSTRPYPYICIDVENANELEIGGSDKNYFYDFKYGIYANTSEVEVFNGTFDQNIALTTLSKPDPNYAAIYCIGPTGAMDYFEEASCKVTNTNGNVTFTDCQIGIFCREFYLSCNDAVGIGNGYDIRMPILTVPIFGITTLSELTELQSYQCRAKMLLLGCWTLIYTGMK